MINCWRKSAAFLKTYTEISALQVKIIQCLPQFWILQDTVSLALNFVSKKGMHIKHQQGPNNFSAPTGSIAPIFLGHW